MTVEAGVFFLGDTGVDTGPPPAVGFRKDRGGPGVWKPILPGSWVDGLPVPTNPQLDANSAAIIGASGDTPTDGTFMGYYSTSKAAFSTQGFSPVPWLRAATDASYSVCLVNAQGEVASTTATKARVLDQYGIRIPPGPGSTPPGYVQPGSPPSSDSPHANFTPDVVATDPSGAIYTGELMEAFRLAPAGYAWDQWLLTPGNTHAASAIDPRSITPTIPTASGHMDWECQSAARMLDLANAPGHLQDRYPTANPSTQAAQFRVAEDNAWGVSATHIPILPNMLLDEDIQEYLASPTTWVPRHALGIATPAQPGTHRWPAQGHDATAHFDANSKLEEGIILRLPRTVNVRSLGLHPLAEMVFLTAQEWGFVIWDSAGGTFTFRCETSITQYYGAAKGFQVLNGGAGYNTPPWDQLQVVAEGTDASQRPVASGGAKPTNLTNPSISAAAPVHSGDLLTEVNGTWNNGPITSRRYQWRRDGADIAAATSQTYTTVAGDVNHSITVAEWATNSTGESVSPAVSAGVTVISTAPTVTIFDTSRSRPTIDTSNYGTPSFTVCQHRDLVATAGSTIEGINVTLPDFSYGGHTWSSYGYSIARKASAPVPANGKHPCIIWLGSGLYTLLETGPNSNPLATTWTNDGTTQSRPDSTAGEILTGALGHINVADCPNHTFNLAKNAGWYIILPSWPRYPSTGVGGGPFHHTFDGWCEFYLRLIIDDLITNRVADPKAFFSAGKSDGGYFGFFTWSYMSDGTGSSTSFPGFAASAAVTQNAQGPAKLPAADMIITAPAQPSPILFAQVHDTIGHKISYEGSGSPGEPTYAVHITPTHTSLTSTDNQQISTMVSGQSIYSSKHTGEGLAYMNGVAGSLVTRNGQAVASIGDPDGDTKAVYPGTKWEWGTLGSRSYTVFWEIGTATTTAPHIAGDNIYNAGDVYNFFNAHKIP